MNHKQKTLSHTQHGKLREKKGKILQAVTSGLQLYPGLTDGP